MDIGKRDHDVICKRILDEILGRSITVIHNVSNE